MNNIFIIVVLEFSLLSSAVMLTTPANQDNNNGTGKSECANLKLYAGECTNYNDTTKVRYQGYCPYIFKLNSHIFVDRHKMIAFNISSCNQLNEVMCGQLKREGLLCSKCKKGYGPDLYSRKSNCVRCSKKTLWMWILYLAVLLTPLTVFFLIVIIFNVCATSPPFTAFILYCQIFTNLYKMNPHPLTRMYIDNYISPYVYKLVFTVIDIWSLDFFRHFVPPFCVSSSLSNTHVLMLELLPPFYILVLIVLTYILIELHARNVCVIVQLWRPFHKCVAKLRRSYDPKASIFNAFATFTLLSFSNILFVGSHLICTVRVDAFPSSPHNHISKLYYDPGELPAKDTPYFIPVIILLTGFILFPILLLCLYPIRCIRKIIFLLCCKDLHFLQSFVDAFQGHYKDGTNGTRDYRAMASSQFMIRVILYSYLIHHINTDMQINLISLICMSICYLSIQPYKKKYMNITEGLLYCLAAILTETLAMSSMIPYTHHIVMMYLKLVLVLLPSAVVMFVFLRRLIIMVLHLECTNNSILCTYLKTHLFKMKEEASTPTRLPHRLEHPNEYTPLL